MAGDPALVPWLIRQMTQPQFARIAGESFSVLTGADLEANRLRCAAPENQGGPTGDLEDDAAIDEDEGLPWPDAEKIAAWWRAEGHRFPGGRRFFIGQAPSVEGCRRVLRHGVQRQRIAAAQYLCLLQPGTKLFPTSAPAWRQQRWLDAMGA